MRVAGREALKCKRLIGALRSLWRSSKESHDDRVHHLKTFLRASPTRGAAPAAAAPSEPGEGPAPAGSASEGADHDSEGSPQSDSDSGDSGEKFSSRSDDGSVPSIGPEKEPLENLTDSDSSDNKSNASHGTLSADTLELGKESGKEAKVEEVSDTDQRKFS